jgi:uncharacterized protein DUF1524
MPRWLSKLDDVALVAVIAVGGWWGYHELRPAHHPAVSALSSSAHVAGSARATLDRLAVKGRAPKTGYARSQFGDGWVDVDRNGCDTRNDILRRDLADASIKDGTYGCVVLSGTRDDPYTGRRIPFVKGNTTSTAIQIDHVVALSDAWQKGAQGWDADTRIRFANDPLNLLAVSQSANQSKSDGDAATWLPPNKSFRCDYVARQIAVKASYGLWVTGAERDAMARVLATCPGERLPSTVAPPPAR